MTDQENESAEQKIKPKFEHIALNESSTQKIDRWLEQVGAKKKVRIPRKELLNWWLRKAPDHLSNSDLNTLVEEFYDEEAFLRQRLRDVKKAKKEGLTEPVIEAVAQTKKSRPRSESIMPVEKDNLDASELQLPEVTG